MKNMTNTTHIEGYLYEHDLQIRESGPNSKNPGTVFIMGNVSIATDDKQENIVQVHFSYVTATTSKGNANATFGVLKDIVEGKLGTVMDKGVDAAAKLRIDSAIGLNDFYVERNGKEELVSAKRNEGGFVHTTNALAEDEKVRNTFKCDMLITGTKRIEADEEKKTPEKLEVKGYIFDFRKALLPVTFTALNPNAMDYFEGLDASSKNPTFTQVWGRQVSMVSVRQIVTESAFGDDEVREVTNTRRDFVITGAAKNPYDWDDEATLTAAEMNEAMAARETYLATVKQRADEYKASRGNGGGATAAPTAAPSTESYNF
jgi:hypothetical protein